MAVFDEDAKSRAEDLMSSYACSDWHRMCTAEQIQINFYVLDVLDRIVGKRSVSEQCLDIGSAHWNYLPALAAFSQTPWQGVELDAHQRYIDFTTRRAQAEYMASFFPGSAYHVGSVLQLNESYNFITWLLPYVCIEPLHYAGLPKEYFQPDSLLQHVWGHLKSGGVLFVINQGEQEAEEQGRLFAQLGVQAKPVKLKSVFSIFKKQRFAWCVEKL